METRTEEWKDVEGYEGIYQVSNLGRVRSLDRTCIAKNGIEKFIKGQIIVHYIAKDDYCVVKLRVPGIRKSYRVHRLVAQAFIPNPDNLPEVNHIDEDKHNNHVDNLEWCTQMYNSNYGTSKLRLSINHKNHPQLSKPVEQYAMDGKLINTYPSAKEAARKLNLHAQNIGACCRGEYSQTGGFIWKYKHP